MLPEWLYESCAGVGRWDGCNGRSTAKEPISPGTNGAKVQVGPRLQLLRERRLVEKNERKKLSSVVDYVYGGYFLMKNTPIYKRYI